MSRGMQTVRVALILAVWGAPATCRAAADRPRHHHRRRRRQLRWLVAGAAVKAIHVGTNTSASVTTSPQGTYTIPQLPVGAYVVTITATGFDHHAREHRGDGRMPVAWTGRWP